MRLVALTFVISMASLAGTGCDGCVDPAGNGDADGGTEGEGEGEGDVDGGSGQQFPDGGGFTVSDGGVLITEEGPDGGTVTFECFTVTCPGRGEPLACADCTDDDDDGFTDFRDPECLGPCDNTEGPGLESGAGGTSGNSCGVDCYFDFGNGPGNDECHWDHRCDELEPEDICAPFEADLVGSRDCPDEQEATCAQVCRPITPNGCDCFGCCDLGAGPVWIGNLGENNESLCTLALKDDPTACPPCTPVENCFNDCARCELCIGKTEVPDDCFVPPPAEGEGEGEPADAGFVNPDQCDPGIQACGLAGQAPCNAGTFCISGCCVLVGG